MEWMLNIIKIKIIMKYIISILISAGIIAGAVVFSSNDSTILGSVAVSGEYNSVTTYSKLGVPLFTNVQTIKSNTSGTLGSVVITGAVAGSMRFMDATSTTDISSSSIAIFPASTAAGTYTFDVNFYRGLIVESTSTLLPTTTITYR